MLGARGKQAGGCGGGGGEARMRAGRDPETVDGTRDDVARRWATPRAGRDTCNDETKMQTLSYNLGILLTPYLHASSASKADSHHEAPAVHGDAVAERRRLAPRARFVNPDDLDDCKRRQVVSVLHAGVPVAADERVEA